MRRTSILLAIATLLAGGLAAQGQTTAQNAVPRPAPPTGEKVTISIDSIDSNEGYVMVTVMSAGFTPVDYAMRPAKVGSLFFMLTKPADGAPFSVMAFQDVNGNRQLDLDDRHIPIEKSVVKHFTGEETEVSAALKYYNILLEKDRYKVPEKKAAAVEPAAKQKASPKIISKKRTRKPTPKK